ncbi:MAG: histone deacetylase family protein [Thermodesulfobacteriota bacterium]
MKVVFSDYFYTVYTSDPASEAGRMESIVDALPDHVEMVDPEPCSEDQILLAHTRSHVSDIKRQGLYDIASLAAGAAIESARIGLDEPAFGAIRPPGHHASADSAWGFCFFNNMAIALLAMRMEKRIDTAMVLDIDLHYGDGTENILHDHSWVRTFNFSKNSRESYLQEIERILSKNRVDLIGISAGFDNHKNDWGGLLATEDYHRIGKMVSQAASASNSGYFALLEGGYNHKVLGSNAAALINGMSTMVS